uniref:Putative secreted protein n=1 Tax=Haematobia irritans TaxID=7368 RepID=A0A1L8EIU7_HAEIR
MDIFQIFLIIFLLAHNIRYLWANCNVCLTATQMACVSETEFQFCVNNLPMGPVSRCPDGFICTTTTTAICQPNGMGFEPTCGECNKCNSALTFACTGTNTYALCLGTNVPSPIATGTCGAGLVCNLNSPQICGDPTNGNPATCPAVNDNSTTPTPTPNPTPRPTPIPTTGPTTVHPTINPPSFAQSFCQNVKINARMSLPANMNKGCKHYIYCFLTTNATWSGQIYTCPGSTYFDDQTKYCVVKKPVGC